MADLNATPDPESVILTDAPVGYSLHRPIFVTDTPAAALGLVATPSESVIVTDDDIPVLGSELEGRASESVTVSETTGTELSTVIVVTDTATGLLSFVDLTPQVSESVVVTDTPLPNLGANNLSASAAESVAVSDSGAGRLGSWARSVEDATTVTDTPDGELFEVGSPLTRLLTESVAVSDTGRGFLTSTTFLSDVWKVPYERRLERVQYEYRAWRVPHERRVWRITRKTP